MTTRNGLAAVMGVVLLAGWVCAGAPPEQPGPPAAWDGYLFRLPRDVEVFDWKVDLSGEVRLRGEHWSNVDLDHDANDGDGRFFLRTRVRADILFSEAMRAVVELVDAREWESDRHPRPHNDELDLHQAYVQFDGLFGAPLMLRVGRQEIDLSSRRIIAAPTWGNLLRSFDAVRLSYVGEEADIHGFLGSVVVHQDDHFNEHAHGEAVVGLYSTVKGLGRHKLDVYSVNLVSRASHVTGEDGRPGDHKRYTVGARLYGSIAPRWKYDLELAHQRGTYAHDHIRAWAFHADTAYTFDLPWQPTVQPLFNWASGDRNPLDGRHNTFLPPFPNTHGPYGIIDFFHWMNVREIGCRFKLKPVSRLTVIAEAHRYWLDEEKDAWYSANRRPKRRDQTGRSGDSVGHELSLTATYRICEQLSVGAGWARFFPGQFSRNTGPDDNADFWYLQTVLRF